MSPSPSPYVDESTFRNNRYGTVNNFRSVDGGDASALRDHTASQDEKVSDGASSRPYPPPTSESYRGRGTKTYTEEQADKLYWVYF